MHEKTKNEKNAKSDFDKRVREAKEQAIKENIEKATATGNKLTQSIDDDGQLVSNNTFVSSAERNLTDQGDITSADIKKELFEGEDIVTDKNTDHGLSNILKNKVIED